MKYLVVDACLSGTGVRDKFNGGYIAPNELNLSSHTITRLNKWLKMYENEHYEGFNDERIIEELDYEGKEIAIIIRNELVDVKIEYFSDARMKNELI